MCDARTGGEARDPLARHVAGEFRIDVACTRHAFLGKKPERTTADHLVEQRAGRGLRQPLRHDHRHQVRRLCQRLRQQREWSFQAKLHQLVGRRRQFVGDLHQRLSVRILGAPTLQAGRDIAGQHWRAVMKYQPVAQRELPGLLFVLDSPAGQHLWLHRPACVECEQCVEHHHNVVARYEGTDQRIDQCQIGVGDEFQRRGGGGTDDGRARETSSGKHGSSAAKQVASFHMELPAARRGVTGRLMPADSRPDGSMLCRVMTSLCGAVLHCNKSEYARTVGPGPNFATRPDSRDRLRWRSCKGSQPRRSAKRRVLARGESAPDQNSSRLSRRCLLPYAVRTSPRCCNAGTSPSVISAIVLRFTFGIENRKPSPPTSSITSPICAAT